MTHWEYRTHIIRLSTGQGKVPGYFNRSQPVRVVHPESLKDLNDLGRQGWELVSVVLLELGTVEAGPTAASAFLKRPYEMT